MPSANPKLEKQASTEALEPIRQAIVVVEHKIRNLEKRKGRLESYRDIVKNGGELNADQKQAVDKYDEVIQTLEMMRELNKQIVTIANDSAKQQKKLARKEALERQQQDISKVREVLLIQDTLMSLAPQKVRDDFLSGSNGAVKLTEEDFKYLDDLQKEVILKHERKENEPNVIQQAQKIAEHYVLMVDGKQREVFGTTYSKLKEITTSVTQCGYFDQVQVETTVEEVTQVLAETNFTTSSPEQQQVHEKFSNTERHIPPQSQSENVIPLQTFPVPLASIPAVVSGTSPIPGIPAVVQPIASIIPTPDGFFANAFVPAAAMHQQQQHQPQQQQQQQPQQQLQQQQQQQQQQQSGAPAPRLNDIVKITQNANFFFLQDEEIEPEVSAPPPQSPPPPVSLAPPVVATAMPITNAHIPTQTFTNQQFAAPHIVQAQVMYSHQSPELSHLPTFGSTNPPPPIPMPPSHQNMPFGQPNPASYQQTLTFEQTHQEVMIQREKEEIHDLNKSDNDPGSEIDLSVPTNMDWANSVDTSGEWNNQMESPQSGSDSHLQNSQTWGIVSDQQRSNFRGRGRGRGNPNGYNNRGRGNYQQNGSRGTYYRNNDSNYQNGYPQRNWNNTNDGGNGGGYNNGFKRTNIGQPRGGLRGENRGMDRGGRGGGGGQFRGGNPRGASNRPNYVPRGKPQPQN